MSDPRIGASFGQPNPVALLNMIKKAEAAGVSKVWLTTGSGSDGLTVFAAASQITSDIDFGTAIVHSTTRHPLIMAQQASEVAQFAPGRFTLGIGPGAQITNERRFGLQYERPLEYLREYVTVVKQLLTGQRVDFDGKRLAVHGELPNSANVPVIISALQSGSFELAGEVADGAVTWNCAAAYIRDVARPAIERGAKKAGRPAAQIVGHAWVSLTTDRAELDKAVQSSIAFYSRSPHYQAMFAAAGFPEAHEGMWSERMVDSVVLHGDDATVAQKVREFLQVSGSDQLILSAMPVGEDRNTSIEKTLTFIGGL